MKIFYTMWACFSFFGFHVAPPVKQPTNKVNHKTLVTDGLSDQEVRSQEYFRYLNEVFGELEKDPTFQKKMENITEDDINTGKIVDILDLVGHDVRLKMDEVKRMEVEYQRDLLRQQKHHMTDEEENYWNPIHHDNKQYFEKEDLTKLLHKHNDILNEQDRIRHEEFKKHELEKEHKRREAMKNMTEAERLEEEKKHDASHHRQHEKLHEPGHRPQMEEVWEKEDGFDAENFEPKTFFHLHDKNGDGYWDYFELETLFLHDLDKIYNTSDPNTDLKEREEEMERMREHVIKYMDHDRDGLISLKEYLSETEGGDYSKEEEWKPIIDEDQFTEDELSEYERLLDDSGDHHDKKVSTPQETNAINQAEQNAKNAANHK